MSSTLPKYLPGAMPQFHRGNEIGCLVVHGFMAAPPEVGWMGSYLVEQGYTVYVPRMTGHGINHRYMARMRWEDWYAHLLDSYHILRQQCEQVYVIGHSNGGLLGLLLSTAVRLDGLVAATVPFYIPDKVATLAMRNGRWLRYLIPYTTHPSEPELNAVIEAEQERRGEKVISRIHYDTWSTRAVHEFYQMMKCAEAILPQVTVPLLLLYSSNDETSRVDNIDSFKEHVKSETIETHIVNDGAHIIFQDEGREEAFRVVGDFIARRVSVTKSGE